MRDHQIDAAIICRIYRFLHFVGIADNRITVFFLHIGITESAITRRSFIGFIGSNKSHFSRYHISRQINQGLLDVAFHIPANEVVEISVVFWMNKQGFFSCVGNTSLIFFRRLCGKQSAVIILKINGIFLPVMNRDRERNGTDFGIAWIRDGDLNVVRDVFFRKGFALCQREGQIFQRHRGAAIFYAVCADILFHDQARIIQIFTDGVAGLSRCRNDFQIFFHHGGNARIRYATKRIIVPAR